MQHQPGCRRPLGRGAGNGLGMPVTAYAPGTGGFPAAGLRLGMPAR
ncbi:hypothetical protein [Streptomyces sp. NPDC005890]